MARLGWHKTGHNDNRDAIEGLEQGTANSIEIKEKFGGRDRDRTGDPLLANSESELGKSEGR